jgi:phosphatidylglycerophosphate synthase
VVGDCLDGMQARRTNRCSRLGEMMDHWLDAVGVPLTTVGITMALQLPLWAIAPVHIATAMVYNAQLVLYHHTGRFVHPSTSGTDCQLGTSIGYVTMGVVFLLFDRNAYWLDKTIAGIGAVAMVVQARILWFYYVRMKWLVLHHLPSVLLCAGFAVLYLTSIIDVGAFLWSIVLISFRMSGSYVLFTILQQRFHGFDLGIALWATVIAAAHFFVEPFKVGGYDIHLYLPYLACLYMLTRNLIDFVRHFPELKPAGLERTVRTA